MALLRHASLRVVLAVALTAISALTWAQSNIVNDVTRLNPIEVGRIVAPKTIDEIVAAVKQQRGPIAIGGGRYSMGGQTATEQALHLDMREFDKVLRYSKQDKEITVQTGITWRKIQEHIDPDDLSLRIMQTYANFTVGGSLSVNVHGRYIGQGPLVLSVKSIRVVLADGAVVEASPTINREVFYGAIGGYGAMGVIVEATLTLTDNVHVERQSTVMPLSAYREYFVQQIRSNPNVVFHNADIYPNGFQTVRATSFMRTDKPVTVPDRLTPKENTYWLDRFAYRVISEWPGGKAIRQHIIDPTVFFRERVEWRNYEASYDVRELEPSSRQDSTYVLQEYFVPVDKLEAFVPRMSEILNRHHVNVINVSIRHARQDPGTLLAWARSEVFAFVLYYKQGTSDADRRAVSVWTRELIDAVTEFNGAYYLPYQIHATQRQFRAAYPNADKFFALKQRLDPTNKFRNKLWDAYYHPQAEKAVAMLASTSAPNPRERINEELRMTPGYQRDEAQTYLTLPEWFLVYSPDEYAHYIRDHPPAGYPYFGSIRQFWSYYWSAYQVTKEKYGFNWGYHVMVFIIGTSFTAENAIKGAYEDTVGWLSEWTAGNAATAEDKFAARVAQEYVDFIRVEPWYEFSFAKRLKQLWTETDLFGSQWLRKWERKLVLSAEYLVKAQYATIIKLGTKAAYGDADSEMFALTSPASAAVLKDEPKVRVIRRFDDTALLLAMPRYEEFRDTALRLTKKGVRFYEIAGNDEILLTAVVPAAWTYDLSAGQVLFEKPILTGNAQKRIAVNAPVASLHDIMLGLTRKGYAVEHVYDY